MSTTQFQVKYNLTFGGKNRFQSVKNGLEKITDEGIVFIHDGVRPLVSVETLKNCYSTALEKGNALPVVPVTESIRFAEKDESKAVDRSKYYLVQTPQTFKVSQIKKAYKNALSEDFTDDASVLEADGEKIQLVEGNRENIKITFQSDLDIASVLLKNNN
ncbi:MAG: 2-C-methyl-D-erythritol 4-phosphate cytidylyltransferase [Draconibacterium sp.]|nr:2-C-methyl-D-erythritol 4-phosphate cytidylyltransferase [Draconibacterium sp.]